MPGFIIVLLGSDASVSTRGQDSRGGEVDALRVLLRAPYLHLYPGRHTLRLELHHGFAVSVEGETLANASFAAARAPSDAKSSLG